MMALQPKWDIIGGSAIAKNIGLFFAIALALHYISIISAAARQCKKSASYFLLLRSPCTIFALIWVQWQHIAASTILFTYFITTKSMKQYLKLFGVLFVAALVATACSNDDEQPATYEIRANDGRTITITSAVEQYATEESFVKMLRGAELVLPTRSSSDVTTVRDTVYGYDEEPYLLNDVWQQVSLGNWCTRYGLDASKKYLLNYKRITKYIPCTYSERIIEGSYLPTDLLMGYCNGSVGFMLSDENAGGKYEGYTMIAVFGYDIDGNVVDTHYPCEPEDLRWKYFVIDTSGIN